MACWNGYVASDGKKDFHFLHLTSFEIIAFLSQNIELFEWHKKKMIYKNGTNTEGFVKGIAKSLSVTVKNWSGYEKIAEKLGNIPQEAYDNVYKSYVPQEGGFNVLTHGDLFMNNILFRYDQSGKPSDIRFVSSTSLISYQMTALLIDIVLSG